jgi:acyl-coenzyme A thioesterase PaaI-like protein
MSDTASLRRATIEAEDVDPRAAGVAAPDRAGSDGRAEPAGSSGAAPDSPADGAGQATVRSALLSYRDFRIRPHNCFACGELNEIGLHLQLNLDHARCWTELVMPRRFEGWEGIIHGGILCTILDEVMAWALVVHDNWGVTARLSVDFRQPVTVGQSIRAEGWITEAKRRIQMTAGRIVDAESGLELATAQATYVAASEARKRDLKERYGVAVGPSK